MFAFLLNMHGAWTRFVSMSSRFFLCWKMIIRHVSASGGSFFCFFLSFFLSFFPPPSAHPPQKALSRSSIFQRAQLHPLSRPPPLQNISLCKKKFPWMINKSSSTEKKNHLIQLWMDLSCECSWAFVGSLNPPSLCHESIVRVLCLWKQNSSGERHE